MNMTLIKTRINITLPEEVRAGLAKSAQRERIPQATKAARLLEIALEMEEDLVWDKIAQARDSKRAHYVSHAKAWL